MKQLALMHFFFLDSMILVNWRKKISIVFFFLEICSKILDAIMRAFDSSFKDFSSKFFFYDPRGCDTRLSFPKIQSKRLCLVMNSYIILLCFFSSLLLFICFLLNNNLVETLLRCCSSCVSNVLCLRCCSI